MTLVEEENLLRTEAFMIKEPKACGEGTDDELVRAEAHLAEAKAELLTAEVALQHAVHDVEVAEKEVEKVIDRDRPFTVDVIYNGVSKPFEVRHDELVKTLLNKALAAFAPIPNQHTLSLYKGADELEDGKTLEQSGVVPGDRLLLRPSKVKGGAA